MGSLRHPFLVTTLYVTLLGQIRKNGNIKGKALRIALEQGTCVSHLVLLRRTPKDLLKNGAIRLYRLEYETFWRFRH